MLRALIGSCLRYRLVVLILAGILLVGGIVAVGRAPWDVFPEFAPPQIVVQTEAPGLSTEEVEKLVTVPVESVLNGVTRLQTLRSSSVAGLSVVTAIFEEGTDVLAARQLVGERLAQTELPEGVELPRMVPLTSSTSRLLMVGLTSSKTSPRDLRTLVDWRFARRLQAVPGVARVEVFGGEVKQYQVLVDPLRLRQHHLSVDQVLAAAERATGFGGAGFMETPNQRLPIRQRTRIESPADLGAAPVVYRDGAAITLADVAEVRLGSEDKVGDATIDGEPGVLLVIHKQPFFNTLTVTQRVQEAIAELETSLREDVTLHTSLFRQATFIERTLGNLNTAILLGAVLAVLVLILFLNQWRTALISLTAIPLSLLGAILVLRAFGASLNTMTLGGLAIAIGVVVDDAIVDVENVVRRMRENRNLAEPRPAFDVILDASLEVRSAVVHASFIVILVFVPVLFLQGLAGTFFRPLGHAYIIAILISLVIALTVIPAMCFVFLTETRLKAEEPLVVRTLKRGCRRLLSSLLDHPGITIGVAVLLLAATLAVLPFLGGEFLPDFRESNFSIFMAGRPDSSLPESVRMGGRVAARLKQIPAVVSVAQQIGRAELSEDTWGPNVSEVWVVVDEQADYEEVLGQIRAALDEMPGYLFQTKQFLRERMDEVLTGATADVVIRVVGPDLEQLRRLAESIRFGVASVEGVADLRVEQQIDVPEVEVLLLPQATLRYGFSVGQLNQTVQTLLRGRGVGQVYEEDAVFDVVVRAQPAWRSDPALLGQLLVDAPDGQKVPLKAVAAISLRDAPNIINREGGSRRILVTCNVRNRDLAGVIHDIRDRVAARVQLPPAGYHLEFGGQYEARQAARRQLWLLSGIVLAGSFVLLDLDFRSLRLTILVMLSVPLACIGGVAAVLLSGAYVSLGSMIGLITVFGIAVRNGILLVSHYEHLREQEGLALDRELILRGASERLAPILMTALTTALSLLPLVVLGAQPGYEIEHPMAVVIVGGLVSSTLLTLGLLPVLYYRLGGRQAHL
jgi:CzcA family heavy metal efflux pump